MSEAMRLPGERNDAPAQPGEPLVRFDAESMRMVPVDTVIATNAALVAAATPMPTTLGAVAGDYGNPDSSYVPSPSPAPTSDTVGTQMSFDDSPYMDD